MDALERFFKKVKVLDKEACWEWQGAKYHFGHGSFWHKNRTTGAHRFSYELHFGEIPKGKEICHKCDNPSCVNPAHLFLGTHKENMQDCAKKKRMRDSRGELNGRNKLKNEDVLAIRSLYKPGRRSLITLAEKYGVDKSLIWLVVKRKVWSHI